MIMINMYTQQCTINVFVQLNIFFSYKLTFNFPNLFVWSVNNSHTFNWLISYHTLYVFVIFICMRAADSRRILVDGCDFLIYQSWGQKKNAHSSIDWISEWLFTFSLKIQWTFLSESTNTMTGTNIFGFQIPIYTVANVQCSNPVRTQIDSVWPNGV